MDRVEREPLPLRPRLAAVAVRQIEGRQMRHQLRRAPQRARRLPPPRRRHRTQRLADEGRCDQHAAFENIDEGIKKKAWTPGKRTLSALFPEPELAEADVTQPRLD